MVEFGEAEKAAEEIYLRTLDECVDVSDDDLFFFYSCNEEQGAGDEHRHCHFEKGHSISIPCESIKDVFQVVYLLFEEVLKSYGKPNYGVQEFAEEFLEICAEEDKKEGEKDDDK